MIALDPRLQVPDSVTLADPGHPLNVVKMAREVQGQAAADAMYDIPTPDRFRKGEKEGFGSPFRFFGTTEIVFVIGILIFLLVVWLSVRSTMRSLYVFVLMLAFAVFFLIHKKAFDA